MPGSGSGTMAPIPTVSGGTSPAGDNDEWRTRDKIALPIRLTRYAEIQGIPSLLFWGVSRGSTIPERELFFSGEDRRRILQGLSRASDMMESQIRVYLVPKWKTETTVFQAKNAVALKRQHFLDGGTRAFTVYNHGAPVSYSGEYGTVSVAHNGIGDWEEIRIYYPDSAYDRGPEPLAVQIGPANIVLTFAREALVKPSVQYTGTYHQNHEYQPVDWTDIGNFCAALTIAREYTDPTDSAALKSKTCNTGTSWTEQSAHVLEEDARLGWVNLQPATYSGGSWTRNAYCRMPEQARVNYRSGLQELVPGMEESLVRLAHTVMPQGPCSATVSPWYYSWERDRNTEQSYSRERLNCPWGAMDGAWFAWNYVTNSEYNSTRGGGWLGAPHRARKWQRRQLF